MLGKRAADSNQLLVVVCQSVHLYTMHKAHLLLFALSFPDLLPNTGSTHPHGDQPW